MSNQPSGAGPKYRPITTLEEYEKFVREVEKNMYLKEPNDVEINPGPTRAPDGWRPEAFPDAYIGDTHRAKKYLN